MAGDPVVDPSFPAPRTWPDTEEIERIGAIDDWVAVEDGSIAAPVDTRRMPAMLRMKWSSGGTSTR
jgi:hypothetical protein